MGLAEARAAWQTVKTEFNALPDDYNKLNIAALIKDFGRKKFDEVRAVLKDTPATNLSQLPSYTVLDDWGRTYDVDPATGNLTVR